MKKLLLILFIVGCNGHHLAWVDNDKPKTTKPVVELNADLNGLQLTFDDGPNLTNTPKVLTILKKYNLQGTFFVEGINLAGDSESAKERRELLKQMKTDGHAIGNHSYDHMAFTHISADKVAWEIDYTSKLIKDATGSNVELIRLPYGKSNKVINKMLQDRALKSVYWNIDTQEWNRNPKTHQAKTKEEVLDEFKKQFNTLRLERGQKKIILLLHDSKNITPEVLPLILEFVSKSNT